MHGDSSDGYDDSREGRVRQVRGPRAGTENV